VHSNNANTMVFALFESCTVTCLTLNRLQTVRTRLPAEVNMSGSNEKCPIVDSNKNCDASLFFSTTNNLQQTGINPLECEVIIVLYEIIWRWYTGCWWVGSYIWYSEDGTGRGRSPPRPLLAVPNVTAHPSMASVPITVFMYNGHGCSVVLMCPLKG